MDKYKAINFSEKFSFFSETWSPKVIARLNNYHFKLVRLKGEFVWHKHEETDEAFIVLHGELTIMFRDGHVKLSQGEMFVVPKDSEHKPIASAECLVLLVEPKGVINTGNSSANERTAVTDVWL